MTHAVHESCPGEKCRCGKDATHKIGEELTDPGVHNLTAYVCCDCFVMVMGDFGQ